jgi:TonB family protein
LSKRLGETGETRLSILVAADGRVLESRVSQSSGSGRLDAAAIEAVRHWRFTPATVDGTPIADWYHDWRWVFRLDG